MAWGEINADVILSMFFPSVRSFLFEGFPLQGELNLKHASGEFFALYSFHKFRKL